ncbi:ParB/RepB/Spo0J family partition protein [Kitasatospora acidiphila]|uniref:ParB/RepB/Spo0J family partition protein n=1 Tax=Kitasatospora acidiphila TaxID=2567942 RepID=A0A540W928_9ACTN|nr:ParB/RepB/Spo0J family partition protein [Kitasatospora acidiphila]TQF05525.1 ParB/RepB/Spo0J family partition protein [Kitasatospora acidiphila]
MTVKAEARKTSTSRKTAARKPAARKAAAVAASPAPVAETQAAATPGKQVVALKLAEVHRNESQPREYFDAASLMELAASMAERGQLQPIAVRPDEEKGGYEIVIGERRWRAAHLNEAETIDAVILDGPYTLQTYKNQVAENLNREDMTPIEEARAFKKILNEEEGATPESVAADFGKTTQFVNLRLKLLDLVSEVAEQVNKGAIGTQAAVQISQLTAANQGAVLRKWAKGEFATENDLVHFAYQVKQQQDQPFMLEVEDLTEEQRAERVATQRATRSKLDKIERAITELDGISKMPLPELVAALDGQIAARMEQLDRVAKALADARFQLRQAKAAADAREIALNPDAVAPTLTPVQGASQEAGEVTKPAEIDGLQSTPGNTETAQGSGAAQAQQGTSCGTEPQASADQTVELAA